MALLRLGWPNLNEAGAPKGAGYRRVAKGVDDVVATCYQL